MKSLASAVDAVGCGVLETDIFGPRDPAAVAEMLSSLAFSATGVNAAAASWYRVSTAAVPGVVLDDDARSSSGDTSAGTADVGAEGLPYGRDTPELR